MHVIGHDRAGVTGVAVLANDLAERLRDQGDVLVGKGQQFVCERSAGLLHGSLIACPVDRVDGRTDGLP